LYSVSDKETVVVILLFEQIAILMSKEQVRRAVYPASLIKRFFAVKGIALRNQRGKPPFPYL
jgi:hypothetical protein